MENANRRAPVSPAANRPAARRRARPRGPHRCRQINILQIHAIVLCCLSAAVAVITRLFMLSGIYMIIALVGLSIALTPLYLLGYAQVFTGWKNQVPEKW